MKKSLIAASALLASGAVFAGVVSAPAMQPGPTVIVNNVPPLLVGGDLNGAGSTAGTGGDLNGAGSGSGSGGQQTGEKNKK